MKLAFRYHLQTLCSTRHCVDSLVIYLNSPTKLDGTSLLWDVDGNGMVTWNSFYLIHIHTICICSKCFIRLFWRLFYYTAAGVRCRVAAVERLAILHHSADYISFPLGSLGPLWYLWKWSSAHVYARGSKLCCKLLYCIWRVSVKPGLTFSNL